MGETGNVRALLVSSPDTNMDESQGSQHPKCLAGQWNLNAAQTTGEASPASAACSQASLVFFFFFFLFFLSVTRV